MRVSDARVARLKATEKAESKPAKPIKQELTPPIRNQASASGGVVVGAFSGGLYSLDAFTFLGETGFGNLAFPPTIGITAAFSALLFIAPTAHAAGNLERKAIRGIKGIREKFSPTAVSENGIDAKLSDKFD
ncbi:MAG: hypothetical protein ACT4TC_13275 [Myxococcaceae bacterium]